METSAFEKQMDIIVVEKEEEDDIQSLSVSSERASTCFDSESSRHKTGEKEAHMEIAHREQQNVQIIRVITFVAVIVCAVVVCGLVYFFAKGSDQSNFELEVSERTLRKRAAQSEIVSIASSHRTLLLCRTLHSCLGSTTCSQGISRILLFGKLSTTLLWWSNWPALSPLRP